MIVKLKMILFVLILGLCVESGHQEYCTAYQDSYNDEVLRFIPEALYPSKRTCANHYTEMSCCAQGYSDMYWERLDLDRHEWKNIPEQSRTYYVNSNQTLVLEIPFIRFDNTSYRCIARNHNGSLITHTIQLLIDECRDWPHPPEPILPGNQTIKRLPGSNLTVICSGFFGPDYKTQRQPANITWRRKVYVEGIGSSESVWVAESNKYMDDGHVYITINTAGVHTMSSELHIVNVSEADYGSYSCHMANSVGGKTRTITLIYGDPDSLRVLIVRALNPAAVVTSAVMACVLALGALALLVYFRWGVDISLFYKDRFRRSRGVGKLFDAFVVHDTSFDSEDGAWVMSEVVQVLERDHGYSLCVAERDFIPGEPLIHNYYWYLETSECTVFVLTEDLLLNDWCRFLLHHCINKQQRDMVFLLRRPVPPGVWDTDHLNLNTVRASVKVAKHRILYPAEPSRRTVRLKAFTRCASKELLQDMLKEDLEGKIDVFWKRVRLALPAKKSSLDDVESQRTDVCESTDNHTVSYRGLQNTNHEPL